MIWQLKGNEFEELILFRAKKMEEEKRLTLGRYGVQLTMFRDPTNPAEMKMQPIHSLPDFEGVISGSGRQIIIEAKVCSQASYPIYKTHNERPRQIAHMIKRSNFGALCYLLIHFNGREMAKKTDQPITIALPVDVDVDFWREFEAAERKNIDRSTAEMYGTVLPWNLYSDRATKLTPDLSVLIPK